MKNENIVSKDLHRKKIKIAITEAIVQSRIFSPGHRVAVPTRKRENDNPSSTIHFGLVFRTIRSVSPALKDREITFLFALCLVGRRWNIGWSGESSGSCARQHRRCRRRSEDVAKHFRSNLLSRELSPYCWVLEYVVVCPTDLFLQGGVYLCFFPYGQEGLSTFAFNRNDVLFYCSTILDPPPCDDECSITRTFSTISRNSSPRLVALTFPNIALTLIQMSPKRSHGQTQSVRPARDLQAWTSRCWSFCC